MTEKIKTAYNCKADMEHSACVWSMVRAVSKLFNESDVSYDEFCEIFSLIDHYTHHAAEIEAHSDWVDYQIDNDRDDDDDEEEELEEEDFVIDIDGEDGQWYIIPEI